MCDKYKLKVYNQRTEWSACNLQLYQPIYSTRKIKSKLTARRAVHKIWWIDHGALIVRGATRARHIRVVGAARRPRRCLADGHQRRRWLRLCRRRVLIVISSQQAARRRDIGMQRRRDEHQQQQRRRRSTRTFSSSLHRLLLSIFVRAAGSQTDGERDLR